MDDEIDKLLAKQESTLVNIRHLFSHIHQLLTHIEQSLQQRRDPSLKKQAKQTTCNCCDRK